MFLTGDSVRWAAKKAKDLVSLERDALRSTELSAFNRARFVFQRYRAVLRNRRELTFLGQSFHYDNRLMPLLLPAYLPEIRRLSHIAQLSSRSSLVDIGANVGQFAATFAWKFGEARIWSFEPNPTVVPLLVRNAAASASWQVIPWGIAERDHEATLWSVDEKSGQASVFRDNAALGLRTGRILEQKVCLRRLSSARMADLEIPAIVDVLKVDVEGAEETALRGVADLQWRFLVIETSLDRDGGLTVSETLDLVESLWAVRPRVLWSADRPANSPTADLILAMPHSAPRHAQVC
jgi:FkbM family methyltransferase